MSCYDLARKHFNDLLHDQPCLACGSRKKIEADHIRPISLKTLSFAPRSHKGLSYFFAVPLCQRCHQEKTLSREEEWYESNVIGGMKTAYALALALSLEAWESACDDYKNSGGMS